VEYPFGDDSEDLGGADRVLVLCRYGGFPHRYEASRVLGREDGYAHGSLSLLVVRPRIPRTLARSAGAVLVPKFTASPQVTLLITAITCSTLRGTLSPLTPFQTRIRQPVR